MNAWSRCTACKRDIGFGAAYWQCSVSTCNRRNTDYTFCSVACWDSHLSTLRHREAWAVEANAPTRQAWAQEQAGAAKGPAPMAAPAPAPMVRTAVPAPMTRPAAPAPAVVTRAPDGDGTRRVIAAPAPAAPAQLDLAAAEPEMLIVISKLKKYIRERSGMNTSDSVADVLSVHVRAICDEAIRNAAMDERKTVLDRDVPTPRR